MVAVVVIYILYVARKKVFDFCSYSHDLKNGGNFKFKDILILIVPYNYISDIKRKSMNI